MKIVFFGTSNVALPILEALSKQHEILAVVTRPDVKVGRKQEIQDSPVSVLATEMKLKILKPQKVKGNKEFYEELKNFGADIFVVVSYGQIMPSEIINMPKYKTINVHFSVLPKYRGPSPIQFALLNGESYTGTSVFILDEKVDHGPLLATEQIQIDADDNFLTLSQKLAYKSAVVINEVIANYVLGKITPLPQNEALATYTKIITKADGKVDWSKTAGEIYNQFRAFYPWPGLWTTWQGKILKLTDIQINPLQKTTEPGKIGKVLIDGIVICGNGTSFKIKTLQLEGKTEMTVSDFVNGNRNFLGSLLG
jgi:methionyl-tRNA formyltransferase